MGCGADDILKFIREGINDFAMAVAKSALWIAESQMLKETEEIVLMHLDFLPLKTSVPKSSRPRRPS